MLPERKKNHIFYIWLGKFDKRKQNELIFMKKTKPSLVILK